jgi:hypothetical protein
MLRGYGVSRIVLCTIWPRTDVNWPNETPDLANRTRQMTNLWMRTEEPWGPDVTVFDGASLLEDASGRWKAPFKAATDNDGTHGGHQAHVVTGAALQQLFVNKGWI